MSWLETGWQLFEAELGVKAWLAHARPAALMATRDPDLRAAWLRHGGTWFVGVDALENDAEGRVAGSGPFTGKALAAAEAVTGKLPLHKAQVSAMWPGYPRQDMGESDANHRFRRERDAAHLDGLKPIGPTRARMLEESHAWVLGLPVTRASRGAAPLVVWEGSHEVMRARLGAVLAAHEPCDWAQVDLTEAYQAARREVFASCPRVVVESTPGEVHLLHRLTLHGVARWEEGADAAPEGRVILYFRPCLAPGSDGWINLP